LLQYDRMNDEEKLEKYLEIEPDLLIFDESKKNAEIEKLRNANSEKMIELQENLAKVTHKLDIVMNTINKDSIQN